MSGPKKSEYQLQKEREEALRKQIEEEKRRLERQRKLELERQRERERQEHVIAIKEKRNSLGQWKERLLSLKAEMTFLGVLGQFGDALDDLLEELRRMSERQIEEKELDNVRSENQLLTHFMKEKQQLIEQLEEKAKQFGEHQEDQLAKALDDIFKSSEHQYSGENGKSVGQGEDSKEELLKARELRDKIIEEIQGMEEQRAFSKKHHGLIEQVKNLLEGRVTYQSYGLLKDFYSGEYQQLKKSYKNFMHDFNRHKEPFFNAYDNYLALCQMVGEEAKAYAFVPEMAQDMIDQLQYEIERLEELAYEQKKDAYIRDSITEVMKEMGYDILASKDIVKKSGKQIKNKIFAYGEGSGIQVIEDNGAITMEVIGLEKEVSRMATEEEMDFLLDEQVSFCNSFAIMEEKLKEKGISRAEIMHLTPAKEHAKLVNLSQYENRKETVTLVTERKNKTKQKASSQKYKTLEV